MSTNLTHKTQKWPALRVGILSLLDMKGQWTAQQIEALMPPPKTTGNLNETLLRGSISTSRKNQN